MHVYLTSYLLGKPDLKLSRRCLTTSCLERYEDFLYDELEPLDICDFLFEERAVDIPSHDKITEPTQRRKQIECLLKTVKENQNDCFYFFLYILQREGYNYICQELEKRRTPVRFGMFTCSSRYNRLFVCSLLCH